MHLSRVFCNSFLIIWWIVCPKMKMSRRFTIKWKLKTTPTVKRQHFNILLVLRSYIETLLKNVLYFEYYLFNIIIKFNLNLYNSLIIHRRALWPCKYIMDVVACRRTSTELYLHWIYTNPRNVVSVAYWLILRTLVGVTILAYNVAWITLFEKLDLLELSE